MKAHPFVAIERVFKSALRNIGRNTWFALASTTIMTLTLITASSFFILTLLINQAAETAKGKVGVATVNLKEWVSEREIGDLKKQIGSISGVQSVTFVSKDEALRRFKEEHKDDKLLLDAVSEENPLFNALEIRVLEPEDFAKVKDLIGGRKISAMVEEFSFEGDRQATIERIAKVSNFIKKLGVVLSLLFVVVASVIIYNTVRLGIFSRRMEIEIMYLNGATRGFIRSPFLIEGGLYGFFAMLLAIIILGVFMGSVGPAMANYFGDLGNLSSYIKSNIPLLISGLACLGVGVGLFGSWLAVSKHLEVS